MTKYVTNYTICQNSVRKSMNIPFLENTELFEVDRECIYEIEMKFRFATIKSLYQCVYIAHPLVNWKSSKLCSKSLEKNC